MPNTPLRTDSQYLAPGDLRPPDDEEPIQSEAPDRSHRLGIIDAANLDQGPVGLTAEVIEIDAPDFAAPMSSRRVKTTSRRFPATRSAFMHSRPSSTHVTKPIFVIVARQ